MSEASGTSGGSVTRVYRAFKFIIRIIVAVFYRRVDVTDGERWRAPGRPTILAANHANALADPVVVIAKSPGHPLFLAAGSWWRSAPARLLFRLGGVLPIYRRRDGGGARANAAAFEACYTALAAGETLAMFPEGELTHEPSIAPLKTGAARIALGAAADAGVHDVALQPVGIVYEDRGRFRSLAALHVGTPVPVDPWVEQYRSDPRGAARALTDELARGLKAVTVNHESWDDLRLVDRAAAVALADVATLEGGYARRNELRRALGAARARTAGRDDPAWATLAACVAEHEGELAALDLDFARALPTAERLAHERRLLLVALAVLAPPAAVGAVTNVPVALAIGGVARVVTDPAWQATAKGLTGFLLCPVVWGTEAFLARRWGRRAVLGTLVAAPLGGLAWIGWRERRARWREVRAEGRLLETRPDDVRAAAGTRAAVRAAVETLLADRSGAPDGGSADGPADAAAQVVSAATT